jgi:hypothetical protein
MRIIKCYSCEFTLGISDQDSIKIAPFITQKFETETISNGKRYGVIKIECPECKRIKKLNAFMLPSSSPDTFFNSYQAAKMRQNRNNKSKSEIKKRNLIRQAV